MVLMNSNSSDRWMVLRCIQGALATTTATATTTAKMQWDKTSKTTTLHVHHTFLYKNFSALNTRLRRESALFYVLWRT